ncbi:hypothetical protein [Streptomyces sp. 6N223]|uniref:hypothetical protein n=1 Tax=Streptomyces sp. 6N223 TaxID=3457412 RepID=UPI003FD2545B
MENVHYYVLAEEYPKEIVLFIADWATNALGPGMVELADQMAASLRFTPRGSDDKPRPMTEWTLRIDYPADGEWLPARTWARGGRRTPWAKAEGKGKGAD